MLVDLRPKGLTGNLAQASLDAAGLACNKNAIPFDPEKPAVTSGLRLGASAGTTRGFGTEEFTRVGELIAEVLDGLAANPDDNSAVEHAIAAQVTELCRQFPIYPEL
jgi:glycine hydroxymethyltransferase